MPNTQKIIDATLSPAEQDLLLHACLNWAQNTVDVPGAQLISKIQQLNQTHDSLDKTVQRILANEVQRLQTELLAIRALFEPLFGAQPHLDVHTGQWALGAPPQPNLSNCSPLPMNNTNTSPTPSNTSEREPTLLEASQAWASRQFNQSECNVLARAAKRRYGRVNGQGLTNVALEQIHATLCAYQTKYGPL